METIRILHIVTYMGRGGLETMLMNYYRNIDRSKIQFDFLVHRNFEADYDKEILKMGGKIYRLPYLNPLGKIYKKSIKKFFKTHDEYKIVHSHLDCLAGVPLKYAKQAGIPTRIAHAHSTSQEKNLKYLLKLFYKENIKKNATHLFACSQDAGKWMFNSNNFLVINNAIDADRYRYNVDLRKKVRKELGISNNVFLIGNVANFSVAKNHSFLIDIFQQINESHPDSKLLLVGHGDKRKEIEQKVENNELTDKVIFLGKRDDVPELLQAIDVFVMPSLFEGLPLSIVEAQAAGIPCFISDKVPMECKKTDLVKQISLENSAKVWASEILESKNIKKEDTYNQIVDANFDIKTNAKWLENFYLMELKKL